MIYIWIATAVLSIWSLILSILFWRLEYQQKKIFKGAQQKTIQSLLETILSDINLAKRDIAFLQKRCDTIEQDGKLHIQKIGLLRFNPFNDTGGDQSFIVALVDGNDTGLVISGLYSRAGTRWYAKKVQNGQGIEHNLSHEEKQALSQAKQLKKEK